MSTLVAGDAYVDLVARGLRQFPTLGNEELVSAFERQPGGSAGYVAAGLSALGQSVALHSVVGADDLGDFWTTGLDRVGVRVLADRSDSVGTGLSLVFPVAGDRAFVTHLGANALPRRLPRLPNVTHVILSGVLQAPGLWNEGVLADVRWFRNQGISVFVDPNWTMDIAGIAFLQALIPMASHVFLNEREARDLTQETDPLHAGLHLLARAPDLTVVVKLGSRGACAIDRRGTCACAGGPIDDVRDANGAGDYFLAAFTAACHRGFDLRGALRTANHVAALAVSSVSFADRLRTLRSYTIPTPVAVLRDRRQRRRRERAAL